MAERLSTRDLTVSFGATEAVRGVDLEIPAAAVTAIIGPSGSGKSALLRALNRMHDVTHGARVTGQVYLGDREIHDPGFNPVLLRTLVGMVFQQPVPFPTMSIRQNVLFAPRRHGMVRRRDWPSLTEEVLRRTALWKEVRNRLDTPAALLSAGQRQRLCIARALAVRPEVLLMDEPTASLDPGATQQIEELIYELKTDVTIVLVTHNMQQAARVSDRTIFLDRGAVVECGATETLFTNPSRSRTEAYITGRFR